MEFSLYKFGRSEKRETLLWTIHSEGGHQDFDHFLIETTHNGGKIFFTIILHSDLQVIDLSGLSAATPTPLGFLAFSGAPYGG